MRCKLIIGGLLCFALGEAARAGSLTVVVHDDGGSPVEGAVLMASRPGLVATAPGDAVDIDQVDKEFEPFLTVVPVGTRIAFPNSDNIRHHVYSFSEAKRFEIPLYGGDGRAPEIVVDQAGVVALGCNVHDWMRAYVVVTDTPYTGLSDAAGRAEITLPAGDYSLRVWHPSLRDTTSDISTPVRVDESSGTLELTLPDQPRWRAWRSPSAFEEQY